MYTLEQFQKKVMRWNKDMPKSVNKSIRTILKAVHSEVREGYSGAPVRVRTGRTRKAIAYKYTPRNMSAAVYVKEARAFVARFHEKGTAKMRRGEVFEPIRQKYTPKLAHDIMKKLIRSYQASG